MARLLTLTHEGAAAFDLSVEDPLMHLVFTKGASLFQPTFYRTQVEEIRAYAQALLAAEKHEPGFAWKFAAYMRDPARGKGNRVQGSIAPAILDAADPESPFVEEYVFRCLQHRPDDVTMFVAHKKNLGLPPPSEAAKRGMARALAGFDDYQILKYSRKDAPLAERRKTKSGNRKRRSLRLVDAMGLCKAYLDPRLTKLYAWLHAPTRARSKLEADTPILEARRRFFHGSNDGKDFADARLTHEQARSFLGNKAETWRRLFDVKGLVGDLAFVRNVRSMVLANIEPKALAGEAEKRRFEGVWPHQIYAGARAVKHEVKNTHKFSPSHRTAFSRPATPQAGRVFVSVLDRVTRGFLPKTPSLGLADVSGSMFGVPLGGVKSSLQVGDVACLFAALMATELGYCATFADDVHLVERRGKNALDLADAVRESPGMGSTQVAGSVRHLLAILLSEPERPRPRTLFFFSDMQFHPPSDQSFGSTWGKPPEVLKKLPPLDPTAPPLLAVLKLWRETLGAVDVVLWNLAAYDNAPLPSGMDHVLMLSGFDANSFAHVQKWQERGSPGGSPAPKGPAVASKVDSRVELGVIRGF